jgi:thioredoxin reductase (NADPH)
MEFDGLFIFIGHSPNSEMFKGKLDLDERGYLKIDNRYRTNLPGVFAAGEIHDSLYRQVVTSAGMGAAAGIEVRRFLEDE